MTETLLATIVKAKKGSPIMTNATLRKKPDAGNPHVRFDEGEVALDKPRRGSLLNIACTWSKNDGNKFTKGTQTLKKIVITMVALLAMMPAGAETEIVDNMRWAYTISGCEASVTGIDDWSGEDGPPSVFVTIPSTLGNCPVTSIGVMALAGWPIEELTIPDSVRSIGAFAFLSCSELRSVIIPNSVTNIDAYAFESCVGLRRVTLPSSVESIGAQVFCRCSCLMAIDVDAGNCCYMSANNLLLTKDGKTLVAGVNGDVTIPKGVINIGDGAFEGRTGLISVTLPDSVANIGCSAFTDCSGLTRIVCNGSAPSVAANWSFSYTRSSGCTVFVRWDTTGWDDDGDGMWQEMPIHYGFTAIGYNGVYDGLGHGITVDVTEPAEGVGVMYSLTKNGEYTATPMQFTNVTDGVQSVYVKMNADGYNTVTNMVAANVTIMAKPFDANIAVSITPINYVYDGAAKEPTVKVTDKTLDETLILGTDYSVVYEDNVNAGTATVTIKGAGNYTGTVTKEFMIERAVIQPPTGKTVTYSGLSLTSGLTDTSFYRVVQDFGGVAVGTYPVILELVDFSNYRWEDTESIQKAVPFTVTKAENVWTVAPFIENWMFGESPSDPVAKSKFGTVRILYDGGVSPRSLDIGWHTVSFTVEGNDNYSDLYEEIDFEILEPETKSITVICTWDCRWGGAEPTSWSCILMSNLVPCVELELSASAGWQRTCHVPIYDEDIWIDYSLSLAAMPGVSSSIISYGVKAKCFIGANDNVLTAEGWKRKTGVSRNTAIRTANGWEILNNVKGDTLVVSDDRSYGEIFFVENTQNLSIAAEVASFVGVYDGQGHGCSLSVTNPECGWTARYALSVTGSFVDNPHLLTNACVNVPIWCEVSASGFVPVTNWATVTITPKTLTAEMCVLSDDAWFFDGTEKQPDVTVVDGDPNIATTNDYVLSFSKKTSAGKVPVTITGTNNYTGVVVKEFEILKRPVTPPQIPSYGYSGKTQVAYVPSDTRWTVVENDGGVTAGVYRVVLRLTNAEDYKWRGQGEDETDWIGEFKIVKAANRWRSSPGILGWTEGETPSEPKGRALFGEFKTAYRVRGADVSTETMTKPLTAGKYTARFWVEEGDNWQSLSMTPPYKEYNFEIKSAAGGDAEATTTTPVAVPHTWLSAYVLQYGAGDYETAAKATGANGRPLWESYVAGLDPTDEASQFTAKITIDADGVPKVEWSPDLRDGDPPRTYATLGKEDLTDENWTPVTDANKATMKFFKIEVEMGE